MSDPRRLLDGDANEGELELLRVWKDEGPSPRARQAALGLLAAGAAGAASATSAAATGSGGILKAMIVGALAGVVTVGAVEIVGWSGPAAVVPAAVAPRASGVAAVVASAAGTPPVVTAPAPEASAPRVSPLAPVAPAPAPGPAPASEPAEVPSSAPPALPAATVEAPAPRRDLAAEIAAIDAARAALASGDGAQALARLDAHDAAFGGGALSQEALVLRIQALVKLGRRSEAAALGRAFVAAHPTSTHATRLRALLPEIRTDG